VSKDLPVVVLSQIALFSCLAFFNSKLLTIVLAQLLTIFLAQAIGLFFLTQAIGLFFNLGYDIM
jgi:hypothetical protein